MIELKEGIKLTREEFDKINDCDALGLFTLETDRFLVALEDEHIKAFDYIGHFCSLVDKLYRQFEYVIVTVEDKFFGYRDNEYKYLYHIEGVYNKAKDLN